MKFSLKLSKLIFLYYSTNISSKTPQTNFGDIMKSSYKKRVIEMLIIFCIGSVMYSLIEVLYRRHTHWTMSLTGGVLFTALYFINLSLKTRSFVLRGLIGCAVITMTEFLVGLLVNRMFSLGVWDYSAIPGNILGQICPIFSFYWFLLSIASVYVCIFLFWQLNKKLSMYQEFD